MNFRGTGTGLMEEAVELGKSLWKMGKNVPLIGTNNKIDRAIAPYADDFMSAFGKEAKEYKEGYKNVANMINRKNGVLDRTAASYNKVNNLTGDQAVSGISIGKDLETAMYGQKYANEQEAQAALTKTMDKYGMRSGDRKLINMAREGSANIGAREAKGYIAPLGMAKEYMLGGSPLAVYTKGAAAVVGYDMYSGNRESLTSYQGQQDIAGVPFI